MSITGWLPVDWRKAVIPIGLIEGETFTPLGTAFLLDYRGLNVLVTAKHCVFEDGGERKRELNVLLNRIGTGAIYFPLDELVTELGVSWKTLDSTDIAATILLPDDSNEADIHKFSTDILESSSNIREGDDIFLLGFPLSLGVSSSAKVTPIVRTGIVALRDDDKSFLVDANVFPGSSGSPVFLRPSPFEHNSGGLRLGKLRPPRLLGIVTSYLPFKDVAVSQQTGETRVTFEENSGLGSALSAEIIMELLNSRGFQDMADATIDTQRTQSLS